VVGGERSKEGGQHPDSGVRALNMETMVIVEKKTVSSFLPFPSPLVNLQQ